MDKIWKFDGSMTKMPTPEEINSVSRVGYQILSWILKTTLFFLKNEGMKLGLGGIGQGFIADKIKAMLVEKGVWLESHFRRHQYLGKQLDGNQWKWVSRIL
jgi:thiamine biosynthesis lipoprotein